jgi:Transposase DDE domain group 1
MGCCLNSYHRGTTGRCEVFHIVLTNFRPAAIARRAQSVFQHRTGTPIEFELAHGFYIQNLGIGRGVIGEAPGLSWLQGHLDYSVASLLDELWVLDVDTTIKPLYGEQEGAELGYNPHKPGRPPAFAGAGLHCYHTYMLSNLRLVLSVDVQAGGQHNVKHATDGLWSLLDRWDRGRWPRLLRGDLAWGIEAVMAQAELRNLAYLFRLRTTKNVSRALQRAMGHSAAPPTETSTGDRRSRRLRSAAARLWRGRARSAGLGIRRVGDLARQRDPDPRSVVSRSGRLREYFDELKNQWRWGGFTTHDLKRCRLLARSMALIYNWWSLFVRLADPQHHREAITSRPLLLTALARRTRHAGQVRLADGQQRARRATSGMPGLSAYRRLLGPPAAKCGAAGRARVWSVRAETGG